METRWWAIKVEGYNSWTSAESEAEQARRNVYEVHGPFVLHDDAAIERAARAIGKALPLSQSEGLHRTLAEAALLAAGETP